MLALALVLFIQGIFRHQAQSHASPTAAAASSHEAQTKRFGRLKEQTISNFKDFFVNTSFLQNMSLRQVKEQQHEIVEEADGSYPLLIRSLFLFLLFFPVILTAPLAYLSAVFRCFIWFRLVVFSIRFSGAAFTKWGQWVSESSP
jgi:hypothetical protein